MLRLFRSFLPAKQQDGATPGQPARAPAQLVAAAGVESFSVSAHMVGNDGFPRLDWDAASAWTDAIPDAREQGKAWTQLERAWLEHLQAALGSPYILRESGNAWLLSALAPKVAQVTLAFMSRTPERITRVLDGVAKASEWGKDILIVFQDEETYYRYVSHYYPDSGNFAASGGMYIQAGCGHFVTVQSDLRAIEPVIAHEMTHGCLAHLPIPAWLNEGLAVNTEQRLCSVGAPEFTPMEMHAKHRAFWGGDEIQQFWSGASFLRNDDANLLSYDLARILVSQFSADWTSFRSFVLHANAADAGALAAAQYLQCDLGAAASALLEKAFTPAWRPDPAAWQTAGQATRA